MKKIHYLICVSAIALTTQSCQNEANYKDVRKEVITLHDGLMASDERLMSTKMALDSLCLTGMPGVKAHYLEVDTGELRTEVKLLTERLNNLSDQMSNWMENFKTDMDGKSNAEAVAYFEAEKVKVKRLDSLYNAAITESENYLKRFDIKRDTTAKHEHSMHNM
ncbi:hypothetical protein [Mucilaginibacter antarcticus]|uniref:Lipoprotein n=1 Tax=Mucilaginibacter antarcticus TaxID=1855725 RepID=A0ABW5XHZ9_9SPHI